MGMVEETLKCMGCFLCSMLLRSGIDLIPYYVIRIIFADNTIPYWLILLCSTVSICMACCIVMLIYGYKRNMSYKKKTLKQLLLPIIAAIILLSVIVYFLFLPRNDAYSIYDIEELVERHILSCFLQAIFSIPFMILGYHIGYKKFEKKEQKCCQRQ